MEPASPGKEAGLHWAWGPLAEAEAASAAAAAESGELLTSYMPADAFILLVVIGGCALLEQMQGLSSLSSILRHLVLNKD